MTPRQRLQQAARSKKPRVSVRCEDLKAILASPTEIILSAEVRSFARREISLAETISDQSIWIGVLAALGALAAALAIWMAW